MTLSDVRLTVKSVRFRFQKINRNRNRDLEKKPYFRFLVLFFINALKCFCKSWLTTQITPVLCGNTLKKERIKAKTAKCKLCTKDIAADYGNASIIRRHIENKHKSEFEGLKKTPIKLKNVIKRQFKLCTKQRTSSTKPNYSVINLINCIASLVADYIRKGSKALIL